MSIDKLNKLIREFQGDVRNQKYGLVESINSKTNRVVKPEDIKNGEFTYQ